VTRKSVGEGIAFSDGRLMLTFGDGSRIEIPAGHRFEAWTLAGPGGVDGLKIVSAPVVNRRSGPPGRASAPGCDEFSAVIAPHGIA
jgi:hypothetical protein